MNMKRLLQRVNRIEQRRNPVVPTFGWKKVRDGEVYYTIHGEQMTEAQFHTWSQQQPPDSYYIFAWIRPVNDEDVAKWREKEARYESRNVLPP